MKCRKFDHDELLVFWVLSISANRTGSTYVQVDLFLNAWNVVLCFLGLIDESFDRFFCVRLDNVTGHITAGAADEV